MRHRPILTLAAVGVAMIAAVVQYAAPSAVPLLQRTPGALEAGQWWRSATPLFVQTLGWYQVVTNLVTLALVGMVVERELGRGRWLVLFVAGTVGGQIAAYSWQEPGGGDSIAICGLAGGATVWLLARRDQASRWDVAVLACYVGALTGWGFLGIRAAAVGAVAAAAALYVNRRIALAAAVVCATALAAHADLHGVSLLSGMAIGLLLLVIRVGPLRAGRAAARFRDQRSSRETPVRQPESPT
ncbi:rhomboid family intramembrane serine protease [Kutzneria buriramensis]|uniref:rhomboid family intramembrane serine protease n=1 Tax=Kutzneria buriramensis TaxID=1045776 RepID=UPI00147682E5|nr:rhomboid family intramembrane serine protease [Kutzneria buriramensis]